LYGERPERSRGETRRRDSRIADVFKRLQKLNPARGAELASAAAECPEAAAGVTYPGWYLQRWHFLPEGYLSERGVGLYERIVRPLYTEGQEGTALRAVGRELRRMRATSVAEFGCGPGRGLRAWRAALPEARIAGIDLSPYFAGVARGDGVEFVHGDARAAPWGAGEFDAVVACHVLGHVPEAVAREMLAEAARIVRVGGRLLVVDHAWHPFVPGPWREVRQRRLAQGLVRLRVLERAT
jgi:SAM-dependent methyltransferase